MTIKLNMDRPYGLISGTTPNNARYIQDGVEFTPDKRPILDGISDEKLAELEVRADQEAEAARLKLKAQAELEAAAKAAVEEAKVDNGPVTKEASAEDIERLTRRSEEAKARKAEELAAAAGNATVEAQPVAPTPPTPQGIAPAPPVNPTASQGGDLETMHHMKLKQKVKEAGGEYVDRDQAVAFLRSNG